MIIGKATKIFIFSLVVVGLAACGIRPGAPASDGSQVAPAGTISPAAAVVTSGTVHSNQSALLAWGISGTVSEVLVEAGEHASGGQMLARLDPASLPPEVIRAQADLLEAQKSLDELRDSDLQQARALKAVEEAQQALDDLLNSETSQAEALEAVADAQQNVDNVALQVYLLTTAPTQFAIDQAQANLLLKEKQMNDTRHQIEQLQRLVKKVPRAFRGQLKDAIQGLEYQLLQQKLAYEERVEKYENLVEPPDPTDLAVAQAALEAAQAALAVTQRDYERASNGPSAGEIAVAEAELADAQRERDRLENGPDPEDIAAAEARVAAAQAKLDQTSLTAPFSGVITRVENQPGDPVGPESQAFRLDDLSRLLVYADVSEIDANQIRNGQTARLTFEGIPGKEYRGQVVEVAPVGEETEGAVIFPVTIELLDSDPALLPGMTAEVEIITGTVE